MYDHVAYDPETDTYYGVELDYDAYLNMPTPEEYYDSEDEDEISDEDDMSSIPF